MLKELDIVDTAEYANIQNDYGCMSYTEPVAYYGITIDYIEKQLNKKIK